MGLKIRDVYVTDSEYCVMTGMAVNLGRDGVTDTFGLGVHNLVDGTCGLVILEKEELMRLRDAITKELAQ
jgi:hypothetical protein